MKHQLRVLAGGAKKILTLFIVRSERPKNSVRLKRRVGSARFLAIIALVPALNPLSIQAQDVNSSTIVLPDANFPVVDEMGVVLSSNSLNIPGPILSIGDPKHGGLVLRPTIVGPDALPLMVCGALDATNCNSDGFPNSSTSITATLVRSTVPWRNAPSGMVYFTILTGSGVARFNATTRTGGFVEYSPHVGRSLSYSSGAPLESQLDTGERMTFQDSDGTKFVFFYNSQSFNVQNTVFSINRIVRPNGHETVFTYNTKITSPFSPTSPAMPDFILSSISNNFGYMIKFQNGSFLKDSSSAELATNSVVALNLSEEYCSKNANQCILIKRWPMIDGGRYVDSNGNVVYPSNYYTTPMVYKDPTGAMTSVSVAYPTSPGPVPSVLVASVTDPTGNLKRFTYDYTKNMPVPSHSAMQNCPKAPGQITAGSVGWKAIWTFPCPYAPIMSISEGGSTWTYSLEFEFAPISGFPGNYYVSSVVSTRIDPKGGRRVVTALPSGQATSITDELGRVTNIGVQPLFDANEGRINSITYPLGNSRSFTYDTRGNITSVVDAPAPGSSAPALVTTYVYPASCANWKVCNWPVSMTDANDQTTYYTYDPAHGGVLTQTLPAVDGVQPVKRYAYAQHSAWLKASGSGYVQAATPVWLLSEERTCLTSATVGNGCAAGAADEVVTSYEYQAGSATTPSNLLLKGVAVTSNGTTLRTCYGYDGYGRKISETEPRAGLAVCP